jgi:hypothetical protein
LYLIELDETRLEIGEDSDEDDDGLDDNNHKQKEDKKKSKKSDSNSSNLPNRKNRKLLSVDDEDDVDQEQDDHEGNNEDEENTNDDTKNDQEISLEDKNSSEEGEDDSSLKIKNRKLLGNPNSANSIPNSKEKLKEKQEIGIGSKQPKVIQKVAVPVQKIKKDDLKVEVNSKSNLKPHLEETKKQQTAKSDKPLKNEKHKSEEKNTTVIISSENLKAIQDHKVGWEYRYRVNQFVEKLKANPNLNINEKKFMRRESIEEKIEQENETDAYEGPKPKVGWLHRYRISKFIDAGGNITQVKLEKKAVVEEKKAEKVKKEEDQEEEATIQLGRFKVDKNKIGEIGSKHKYRATNKVKKLIFDNSKPRKATPPKKSIKELPIVEVVEFTENKEIPFCEDFRVEGEDLSVVLVDLAKPKDKIEDTDNVDYGTKPKVGFEHRYRISRMQENEQAKEAQKDEPILAEEENYKAETKPKVGFEYRYRISRMLSDISIDDFKNTKEKAAHEKSSVKKDEPTDPAYDPSLKPKVGFEYRYRISNMLADKKQNKLSKKLKAKEVKKETRVDNKHKKDIPVSKSEVNYDPEAKPKVGFEYRYRISNMMAKLGTKGLKKNEKKAQTTKSEMKPEVVKKESKLKQKHEDEFSDPDKKPKVGFEYRYRLSNLIAEIGLEAAKKYKKPIVQPKKETIIEPEDESDYDPSTKPKVGFEYRYRISKMIADQGPEAAKNYKIPIKEQPKKQILEHEKEDEAKYDPSAKPKVGFEYRYLKKIFNLGNYF